MKAAILDSLGQTPRIGTFTEPTAEDGEVIVDVAAAAIKQLDRLIAAGKHYSSPRTLPVVCGTDGAGTLQDGTPVYFAVNRRPFGAMAEWAPASWTVPLPNGLNPFVAASIVNPALASWLPLLWRAKLRPGETVLVLGATGASGRLAVKAARLFGAGRVIAAGRRQEVLQSLGADATIDLRLPAADLRESFAAQVSAGVDVVLDYVWGPPTEALLEVLARSDLATHSIKGDGIRLVQIGAMAAPTLQLSAAILRASWLTIMGSGTGNFPPLARLKEIVADILLRAANGEIKLEVQRVPLADVANAWAAVDSPDRRTVITPT